MTKTTVPDKDNSSIRDDLDAKPINRIRQLREEQEMTQEELGLKLGLQKSTISKYESRNLDLNSAIIEKICKLFNVSSDYLLGLSNIRNNDHIDNPQIGELIDKSQRLTTEEIGKVIDIMELLIAKGINK